MHSTFAGGELSNGRQVRQRRRLQARRQAVGDPPLQLGAQPINQQLHCLRCVVLVAPRQHVDVVVPALRG